MAISEVDPAELQAEVLALQAVLLGVFRRLARDRPELTPLFCRAFDEAESIMTGVASRAGLEHALHTSTRALDIIEEFRRAVVEPEKCR